MALKERICLFFDSAKAHGSSYTCTCKPKLPSATSICPRTVAQGSPPRLAPIAGSAIDCTGLLTRKPRKSCQPSTTHSNRDGSRQRNALGHHTHGVDRVDEGIHVGIQQVALATVDHAAFPVCSGWTESGTLPVSRSCIRPSFCSCSFLAHTVSTAKIANLSIQESEKTHFLHENRACLWGRKVSPGACPGRAAVFTWRGVGPTPG